MAPRIHPFRLSRAELLIFGSAAALLAAALLLSLFWAQRYFLETGRQWDLDRVERYIRLCRDKLEAESMAAPAEESLRQLREIGLFLDVFPPETAIPSSNPRYVPGLQSVEAWDRVRGPDGRTLSVIRIGRYDSTSRLTLRAVRAYTLAGAVGGVLLLGFVWLGLRRTYIRGISRLTEEIASGAPGPASGDETADPLHGLRAALRQAFAARDSEAARRQRLLDGHEEAACTGTTDGTLLEVNAAYGRMFRKTRDELVGTNYLDLIPPSDRSDALGNLRQLSRRHPANTIEHRIVLPDGSIRWMRWRDQAVLDAKDKVSEVLSFGTDITAEKELVIRLAGLQRAFDQMQSLARTGSLSWNLSADRMEWTGETFRLLGLNPEDTTPTLDRFLGAVLPEDRGPLRRLFERARENGDPFEHEFRAMLPDGSTSFLQSRAEVRADAKTKILDQLTCTLRDITALRDAEAATKRELRFREAIEQSLGVGIVVRDMERRTLSANPAFCVMTGFSEEELKAAIPPDEPYWPVDERPRILAALEQALSGNSPTGGFELVFCRKNGSRFDALVNVSAVLDSNGKPFAILGAVTDISAIQKTRRELAATEKELRQELNYRETIERSTTVGLVAIGADARPLSANDAYCRMLGYSEEEILAWSPPYPCWPEEEHLNIQHAFDLHLQGKTPTGGFQIRLRKKDGTLFDVIITVSPIMDAEGKQTGLLSALTDVTPLQSARRELTASNERLRIAQEVIEFGIWDWDPAADTLFWDRNSFAMFGHPDASDPQEVWKVVHSEEDQERLTYELKRLVTAGGKSGQDRLHARWPDGSVHEILSTYVIIRDAQGKAVRVLGVNRDVTEELEEEREFRSAQERLAAALEGGSFGTFEHLFGVGALNWNAANYEIYEIDPGITDPDELFQAWKAVVGPEYAALEQKISGLPVTKNVITYIFSITVPGTGEKRRINSSVFVERNKKGHPVRLVGISRRLD